jgi:hypothetical protein
MSISLLNYMIEVEMGRQLEVVRIGIRRVRSGQFYLLEEIRLGRVESNRIEFRSRWVRRFIGWVESGYVACHLEATNSRQKSSIKWISLF